MANFAIWQFDGSKFSSYAQCKIERLIQLDKFLYTRQIARYAENSMSTYSMLYSLVCERSNAGTPLARISHRELIDKLYTFLTAFLQLCYELSVMSMRNL